MHLNRPLLRYALVTFFLSGMMLGLFRINAFRERLNPEREAEPVAPAANPFASAGAPVPPPDASSDEEIGPIPNSVPLDIGEIITGAQPAVPVPIVKTPDQVRYEENVIRDFGQFLDPAIRDPDAEGNQKAKNAMLSMLTRRVSDAPGSL